MQRMTAALFAAAAITAGGIWLQIVLSKAESRWFGLILPFITFAYSLLMALSVAATDGMTGWDVFGIISATLFTANIPTLVLLAIYFGYREKRKRKKALEKMSVQDLE